MNGTPTASSSITCLRPVTLSSRVTTPPSITMLFREKRGRPSSGLGGSSGLAAVISATRCCTSEKLKRVTSSRTIDRVGERKVKRSTTGANQNSEVQAALTSTSAAVSSGVCEPGCATARSRAHGQREGIEGDLADGDVAAQHLCDVLGQHIVQHLGHLPGGDATEDQRRGHDAQEDLA